MQYFGEYVNYQLVPASSEMLAIFAIEAFTGMAGQMSMYDKGLVQGILQKQGQEEPKMSIMCTKS